MAGSVNNYLQTPGCGTTLAAMNMTNKQVNSLIEHVGPETFSRLTGIRAIDARTVRRLIEHVGGPRLFARIVGVDFDAKGQRQMLHNWTRRGLPSKVLVANYEILKRLCRQAGL